ncbi:helix-turn-helix domain-containing protein [Megamonas funiformis]|uniref:helix-turn-helix domain-containing protein n=1 Tax=Megamonas funiformis TaxID=437897 RepID=UPI0022E55651|nr:helix-turn-helix transcriptional regulator [Megamonas funiformis]
MSNFKLDLFKFDLARAKKCYNKKQVAKKAGLSYDNLMKILSGRISLTATSLGKIAKALDVEPIELIQDED